MFGFARPSHPVGNEAPHDDRDARLVRIAAVWIVLGLVLFLAVRTAGRWRDRPPTGYALPAIDLTTLERDPQPLPPEELRGKVLLINYWATWCGPCVEEFPDLLRIADAYRTRDDFRFLSVSTGHPDWDALRSETEAFLTARGYRLPVYADARGLTRAGLQGVEPGVIPVTALIDREGRVAQVCVGYNPAALDELQLQIAALLKNAAQ